MNIARFFLRLISLFFIGIDNQIVEAYFFSLYFHFISTLTPL